MTAAFDLVIRSLVMLAGAGAVAWMLRKVAVHSPSDSASRPQRMVALYSTSCPSMRAPIRSTWPEICAPPSMSDWPMRSRCSALLVYLGPSRKRPHVRLPAMRATSRSRSPATSTPSNTTLPPNVALGILRSPWIFVSRWGVEAQLNSPMCGQRKSRTAVAVA